MSRRTEQIGEAIREEVASIISQGLKDPRIGFVTVTRVSLSPDLSSGEITATIMSPLFRVPTTIARHGSRLAAVNARFDLGFPPPFGPGAPPGTDFDVVLVRAR